MEATTVPQTTVGAPGWHAQRDFRNAHIHFVGVGGSGMCGLAAVMLRRGASVSGTDRSPSAVLDKLATAGAKIALQQSADTVPRDTQLLVASAAVPHDHPELVEARRRGLPITKYAQFLGRVMAQHHGISIAGTHGKSTTTAWLTFALRQAGLDPTFVIGAEVEQLGGGSGVGDGPHFVAESCEFDRSFLNLRPKSAAILNIEEDHLDYYEDIADIRKAFTEFARLVPPDGLVVMNGQDANCRTIAADIPAQVETFGLGDDVDWRATELNLVDGHYEFVVMRNNEPLGLASLGLPGRHNVMNALAVTALATHCGVSWDAIRSALADFGGAKRRLEKRGEEHGVTVCDDYAHHPTEIRATLRAARERYRPKRLCCIFQPHQHSRTRFLLEDFARSFELADHVVVPGIYFVRDSERDKELVCSEDLIERIRGAGVEAEYIPDFDLIVSRVAQRCEPGDLIITMGAGDIWKVADELYAGYEPIVRTETPLAEFTWYRLGGPAKWLVLPRDEVELATLLNRCIDSAIPWKVLGRGANVLVRDEGFPGAVFKLAGPGFDQATYNRDVAIIGAAVDFPKFIRDTFDRNLIGLEVLAGIPGTLGGIIRMNAGGRYGEIRTFVKDVKVLDTLCGEVMTRTPVEVGFSYRHTNLDGAIVLGARLQLQFGDREAALRRHKEIWTEKYDNQPPLSVRSAGCIFKNPPGHSAGKLLDETGLKSVRVGGAEISAKHANFIVAHSSATARDVLDLVALAMDRVWNATGVKLEMEVEVW